MDNREEMSQLMGELKNRGLTKDEAVIAYVLVRKDNDAEELLQWLWENSSAEVESVIDQARLIHRKRRELKFPKQSTENRTDKLSE